MKTYKMHCATVFNDFDFSAKVYDMLLVQK